MACTCSPSIAGHSLSLSLSLSLSHSSSVHQPSTHPLHFLQMTALNLAELGIIAEHFCLRADLDRYDENSPTQLFVHCPFDKPHPVSDAVLGVDCIAGVVVRICELCELEVEDSFAEVAQGLREASVDYVTSGRAAYVGVADLLEGAERPRSRSALLYLVGVDDLHISESMLRELYAVPDTVVMSEDELHQRAAVIRGVLDISECLAGTVRQLMDFQRRFQPVWGALFDRWVRERGVSGGAWSEWAVFSAPGEDGVCSSRSWGEWQRDSAGACGSADADVAE